MSKPKTVLAFDFGLRRIGVAVGQDVTGSASPLGVVANREDGVDHPAIAELIREWQPAALVVGNPLRTDGSPGDMEKPVARFVGELEQYGLPVESVDERYTSREAENALVEARKSGSRGRISKEMIDAAAAVIIAERYLASG